MLLVSYSDSEGSDDEKTQAVPVKDAPLLPATKSSLNFAIDKSNPKKIRVNLHEAEKDSLSKGGEDGEPLHKRARVGGGGFSGFNSLLPAPKRDFQPTNGGSTTKGTPRKVFSLKTGAEPGFSREADAELKQLFAERGQNTNDNVANEIEDDNGRPKTTPSYSPAEPLTKLEAQRTGNAMMFKPLSVARNPKKKKLTAPALASASPITLPIKAEAPVKEVAKVSLFSLEGDRQGLDIPMSSNYEPLVYVGSRNEQTEEDVEALPDLTVAAREDINGLKPTATPAVAAQSLDTIASDLNLSASARRQLFGRDGKSSNAVNIVNFNTDQEYAANEVLRASGEQVQHNPLRAIAPGKHSLKQLVNAASGQKEALEESFAAGRRNKKEAGSKYGW